MHIVIIGGGFAGINLAKALTNEKGITVTLVDKNNYNFFPPLIYQVATAFLEPSSISYPFRKFFAGKKNLQFRLGEFLKVIPTENKILVFCKSGQRSLNAIKILKEKFPDCKAYSLAGGIENWKKSR